MVLLTPPLLDGICIVLLLTLLFVLSLLGGPEWIIEGRAYEEGTKGLDSLSHLPSLKGSFLFRGFISVRFSFVDLG